MKSEQKNRGVWLDRTPDAQCGLRFAAALLEGSGTELSVVELPEQLRWGERAVLTLSSWGDVEPELFHASLNRERLLAEDELSALARDWETLRQENAPLRVFENGQVRSAEESYYDALLRQHFPAERCRVIDIIGDTLGMENLSVSDTFLAGRIQHFISSGELAVVEEGEDGFYGEVVRRNR